MAKKRSDDRPQGQPEPITQEQRASADPVTRQAGTTPSSSSLPVVVDGAEEIELGPRASFHAVGIGASAGGIEACIEILEHLPPDAGLAYVIVLHLASDKPSHLQEVLSAHTEMPVEEIGPETRLSPDHVFVVPPNVVIGLEGERFRLEPLQTGQSGRAIDYFFYSLAGDRKNYAIGVVLSGMDSDGALGLRAIKGEGGITMVQSPESARYPDMPRSSISVDHVDIIASPSTIAGHLARLAEQFRQTNLTRLQDGYSVEGEDHQFARILSLMRGVSGVDFRLYKPSTIRRRVARRMLLQRIDTLREYLTFLQANPKELHELQEDALIGVTRFFRDPDVFDALKSFVFPRIFEDRDPAQQVRIWVAGCSTGEEVYSIAICLLEYLTGIAVEPPIQIFGTDASEPNIQKARVGQYAETIQADVSPERLRRFFSKTDKGYQVAKRIRDLCIFARQNLCNDPPFSRMDLISCRNVLIYFGPELQRSVIPIFHYALRADGFLLVGTSETIREFADLFSLADRHHKIYSRAHDSQSRTMLSVLPRTLRPDARIPKESPSIETWGDLELQRAADRILLSRYAPPGVVVNERLEVLQSRGRVSPYLELRPGAVSLDLLRMTRDVIAPQVGAAVRRAIREDGPVQVPGLRVTDGEAMREATLEVLPIHSLNHPTKCYLVVFAPTPEATARETAAAEPRPQPGEDKDRLIAEMRHDLAATRLHLQSLLGERDAKNQELVSANEEIQSANEELQSTNEELETTKEELQSSNEELHTVNDELQNRNAVLTQASNDLSNLLNSVNLPVLMLSNELTIRHFTPPTQRVMNLRPADIGRPFSELRGNLDIDNLTPLFTEVLDSLAPREIEVQDHEGHWYLLRVRPYRTSDNKIEGLVVALVDIDQLRKSQQELRAARDFARSIIQGVPLPLAVVDLEFKIRATNQAFCALTRLSNSDLERRFLPGLTGALWNLGDALRTGLEALRDGTLSPSDGFEFEHVTNGDGRRFFCVRGSRLKPDQEQFLLVTIEDITAHKEAQRVLSAEKESLATEVETKTRALGRSQDELRALAKSLFDSQEEERRRIARELHDDVSQRLAAIEIESTALRSAAVDAAAIEEGLTNISARIATLSGDVRVLSHRLHPSIIEDLGLQAALEELTREFGKREDMIITFLSEKLPAGIPVQAATALYRIAQEALRNVSKHAGKTHTRVSLRGTPDGVQLQVADFGQGFDPKDERGGLGLLSMEERARYVGGTVDIVSARGEGTRITVTVPLGDEP